MLDSLSYDRNTDLPTHCATHDHGGGLASASMFVIYTTTTVPSLHPVPSNLSSLASTVAERIPIHFTISSFNRELTSLPCPQSSSASRETDRLPWYFINAAGCSKHAIAGRGSTVETLLAVLRRPWCVLELCCIIPVSAIEALLAFAKCAAEFDQEGYGVAVALLWHELATREEEVGNMMRSCFRGPSPLSTSALRALYPAIFSVSTQSYNGFWLRLICISALQLGISYSRLGLLLNADYSGGEKTGHDVRRCRDLFFPFYKPMHLKVASYLDRGPERNAGTEVGSERGKDDVQSKRVLLRVYAQVLERIQNEVVV